LDSCEVVPFEKEPSGVRLDGLAAISNVIPKLLLNVAALLYSNTVTSVVVAFIAALLTLQVLGYSKLSPPIEDV